jgi:hypothetical protein
MNAPDHDQRNAQRPARRTVVWRKERSETLSRNLEAYMNDEDLVIWGQDFGQTVITNSRRPDDDEYEWYKTISAADIPRLVHLLGGEPGDNVLDILEDRYSGEGSYRFEQLLRDSNFPAKFWCWP